jgi:predicted type IV restriction endonuclease
MDLSAHDVLAIIVEPVLVSLGWDVRDPRQARRPDASATLKLISSGETSLTVIATSSLTPVPDSLEKEAINDGEWIVVSNGSEWNIFNHQYPGQPLRSLSIKTAESQDAALPVISKLSRETFQKDGLTQAWISEAIDHDIERVLIQHLDGSSQLIDAIRNGLTETGIAASEADIRGALSRINILLGETEITPEVAPTSAKETDQAKTEAKPSSPKSGKAAKATVKKKAKKKAESAKTKSTTAKATTPAAEAATTTKTPAQADVKLPTQPEELGWPDAATHVMHRKKNIAFIKYNSKSGKCTLLPKSLIVEKVGKTLGLGLNKIRNEALESGDIEVFGKGMLQVKNPIDLPSPRAAASFVAAALVKDTTAWKTKSGRSLQEKASSPKKKTSPEKEAVAG